MSDISDNDDYFPSPKEKSDISEYENNEERVVGIQDTIPSIGCVKWFNKRFGFGFLTNEYNNDIFVHYSGLVVSNPEIYKYLVEGEYVEYISKTVPHEYGKIHATNVTGINSGKLMCETIYSRGGGAMQRTTHNNPRQNYRVHTMNPALQQSMMFNQQYQLPHQHHQYQLPHQHHQNHQNHQNHQHHQNHQYQQHPQHPQHPQNMAPKRRGPNRQRAAAPISSNDTPPSFNFENLVVKKMELHQHQES